MVEDQIEEQEDWEGKEKQEVRPGLPMPCLSKLPEPTPLSEGVEPDLCVCQLLL